MQKYSHISEKFLHQILLVCSSLLFHVVFKYGMKHQVCGQLCVEQKSKIWCKNIHTFLRNVLGRFILTHPVFKVV